MTDQPTNLTPSNKEPDKENCEKPIVNPLKQKIDNIKEEYKKIVLYASMALMFIYSIYLLINIFLN